MMSYYKNCAHFYSPLLPIGMVNDNKTIEMPSNNTGSSLEKILADVSKQSATKQILIGAASGW